MVLLIMLIDTKSPHYVGLHVAIWFAIAVIIIGIIVEWPLQSNHVGVIDLLITQQMIIVVIV